MLLHLVSFKYKHDTDAATRADHRQRLAGLKSLDVLDDLKVGEDVVRSPRSYDTGLVSSPFADRAALDAYPEARRRSHFPIAQFGVGICEHIVAVDFEI